MKWEEGQRTSDTDVEGYTIDGNRLQFLLDRGECSIHQIRRRFHGIHEIVHSCLGRRIFDSRYLQHEEIHGEPMNRGRGHYKDVPDHVIDRLVLVSEDEEDNPHDVQQSAEEEQSQGLAGQLCNENVPDEEDTEAHGQKEGQLHLVRGRRIQVRAGYEE